ncbi:aminoglycoside phosphotransferase family protein, partial [Streptomyces sp. NPDC059627]
MTQAPTPTADTVRRLVRSLLKEGAGGTPGPEVRPVAAGGAHFTWWVGARHVLRLAPDRDAAARRRRELRLRDLVRPHLPGGRPPSGGPAGGGPGGGLTLG